MAVADQQAAGTLGFTSAWHWNNPELSDVTLLLATKGGCHPGLLSVIYLLLAALMLACEIGMCCSC
jgi:hypothetical protein